MESVPGNSKQKKETFEELPKEELIKKCRQFLSIAQKAKQAKDVLNEENKTVSKKLEEIEEKYQKDINATQEMLNALTEQKLKLVTENDSLSKQNIILNTEIKNCQQKCTDAEIKLQHFDTENEHLNRQVKRLSEENDQLISHLDTLEKRINELNTIGEQQREQLLILEKSTGKIEKQDEELSNSSHNEDRIDTELKLKCNKYETDLSNMKIVLEEKDKKIENLGEEIDTLKIKNEQTNQLKNFCQQKTNETDILQDKIKKLNNVIEKLNVAVSCKNNEIRSLTKNVNDLNSELEITKKAKEHYNEKFKSYHSKLVKVFMDLKDLKQCKNKLLLIVEEYSKYIIKWQNNIQVVSERLNQEIQKRDSEIRKLKTKNNTLKERISELDSAILQRNNNVEGGEEFYRNLRAEKLSNETKINNLTEELKIINQENEKLVTENRELKCESEIQDNKIISYISELEILKAKIKKLEENEERHGKERNDEKVKYEELFKQKAEVDTELSKLETFVNKLVEEKYQLEDKLIVNTKEMESQRKRYAEEREQIQHLTLLNNQRLSVNNSDLITNLKTRIGELDEEVKNLREENNLLTKERNKLLHEIDGLQEIIDFKIKEVEKLTDISKLVEILKEEKDKINTELQNQHIKNDVLTEENNKLLETVKCNKEEFEILQSEKERLIKIEKEYQKQISTLNSDLDDLKIQVKNNSMENENLVQKMSGENSELIEKINFCEKELSCYKTDISALQNQLALSKRENVELLKEMNDMNQALKERGETISKQQELTQELLKKVKNLEQDEVDHNQQKTKLEEEIANLKIKASNEDISTVIQQKNTLLEEKNAKIKTLEQEIQQLKESFNNSIGRDNQDVDNETMSTSTISKMDESARLKDLEGSWEERYSKLRTLALKLKGKVKEQNEQLSQEKNEKTEIQNKLTTITRNLQSIQSEYDKIQDQYELIDKENNKKVKQVESLIKENEKFTQDLKSNLEVITKLQSESESLRKEKIGSNSAAKQFTNQIQNLKKEIEDSENKVKEMENKISKLESNLNSKEFEFENEIKAHNITKEKLQKIEKEIKKNSVLSLEMEDYERSLKDLSHKLEKKNDIISNLEEKHNTQEVTISALKDQLKISEENILEEESKIKNLETQLLESKTKISISEATVAQKENRIREIMKTLEDYKIKSEEENSNLSKIVSQNQKQLEQLKTERDHLKSVILGLEEKTKELTKITSDREQEVLHLQNEFSSYKVRAQSVLRQNQTRDIALEERLKEEVNELKSQNELLSTQIENISLELKSISQQLEHVTADKSQIFSQCQELEKMLSKEKTANNNLLERQQQLITEHREAIRAQKVHTDTLTQCYKQQIAEQEERHIKEMTDLRATQLHSNVHIPNKNQEENVDIASMPREDAEGSESIESNINNQFSKSTILPLDKLLNSDIENHLTTDYEIELSQSKQRLTEFEAKVKHLTDLLADTEQDLAKHTQLNQMLKEEIRRHQRSVEREKHAENLEYLKNVVFKFLTLNSGDEKSHLVPVLNTILKLSPEETQKLNTVARGIDNSIRGWGSYLPLWSGSNNHQ